MPYCYVEDMSIVAMSRAGAKAVRAHAVRCVPVETVRCILGIFWGLGWGGGVHVANFYFILFSLLFRGVFCSV